MFYANSKSGIILNGLKQTRLIGRKENYTHEDFIKKGKKVMEKHLEEFKQRSSLVELTRIGARRNHFIYYGKGDAYF